MDKFHNIKGFEIIQKFLYKDIFMQELFIIKKLETIYK